ncbi:MAG: hypothetical protein EOP12_02270 [Pseudomonas sp.]|nr:MAG: hypothetical protein EOP12_02270 [Pseudomonas sp.]
MKAKEVRDFMKSEFGARELERSGLCAQQVSKVMASKVFAICTATENPREMTQWGSCVLLNVQGRVFVATAAHVMDDCIKSGQNVYLYGGGIYKLEGQVFIRADDTEINNKKVVVDAAVFEISSPIPDALLARAFCEEMISDAGAGDTHMFCGYAAANAIEDEGKTLLGLTFVPTSFVGALMVAPEKYAAISFGSHTVNNINLGFVCHGLHMQDGEIRITPSFKGMSGGPVLRLKGAPFDPDQPLAEQVEITLTSIIVEYRKRALNDPPLMVCTNINMHLAIALDLINRPEQTLCSWRAKKISRIFHFDKETGTEIHLINNESKDF